MALTHAILVALCERPGSGYELTRRFDRSIGHFWNTTHQQIYRTLRTMDNDGWVQVTDVSQQSRPDKKVYTATASGRTELARWIGEPLHGRGDNQIRELAVKLRGATFGDVAAVGEQAATLRAERTALLETYLAYAAQQFPDPTILTGAALHQHLVLRGGIRAEQHTVEWLDEVVTGIGDTR